VDPRRVAAPAWKPRWCLMRRPCGADDQDGVDGAALDGEWDGQRADGAAPLRTTAPGSQAPASKAQASRRLGHARERGRDTRPDHLVLWSSRLPFVAEISTARWPSSPTARSCGCLHRGSNAQAVSKTGVAARSHMLMASASGIARRPARLSAGTVLGLTRERTARARAFAPAACAPVARAAAGPTESCARCRRGC
jgi:hypothetical protein